MKICVIGTGYVGLVAGTCLADMGHSVICVDNDIEKLNQLKNGIVPIFEPGLEELIKNNVSQKRLFFSNDLDFAVKESKVCFIAVATPQNEDGSADLNHVLKVAKQIAKAMNEYKVIVDKSTVPVGTAFKVKEIIKNETDFEFDVVSNPEFLKQGSATDDFMNPDRVIIGVDSSRAKDFMKEVYASFLKTTNRIIFMDTKSAELTKYASNSFLATKISFINEISNLCKIVGADVQKVCQGITSDSRIGNQFMNPGIGYGGSCFSKDIKALIKTASENNCDMKIISATEQVNDNQRKLFVDLIEKAFKGNLKDKTFALWGLSFKPQTNDMRHAPSIDVINLLLEKGAKIKAFDPKAIENAKKIFKDKISYGKNALEVLENSDALILLSEWNEFRNPDFELMKKLLKEPRIFDARNVYNKELLNQMGIEYQTLIF